MSSSPVRARLWDVDGTLIDTTKLIVAALDHVYCTFFGRTMEPERIRGIIGIPLREQVAMLGAPEDFGTSVALMESAFIQFYEANREMERIIPEAVEALVAGKRAGFRTALVTSKNDEELANTLPRLGIAPYVDAIVSADDVRNPKPDPEGVRLALNRLNSQPAKAIFIGDTVHDMRAGGAAGVRRCAVTWGAVRSRLLEENPEYICDSPGELASTLDIRSHVSLPVGS